MLSTGTDADARRLYADLLRRAMRRALRLAAGVMLILASGTALGQEILAQSPPPRPLGALQARSTPMFANVSRVFVLRGNVFVHDAGARRVLLLDSALHQVRVVLDSAHGVANSYGDRSTPNALRRFRGDSAYFAAPGATQGVILTWDGGIARVAALPTSAGVMQGRGTLCPLLDLDDLGWFLCKQPAPRTSLAQLLPVAPPRDTVIRVAGADSGYIMAVDFTSWRVDTLARVLSQFNGIEARVTRPGPPVVTSQTIELPLAVTMMDLWAAFRDGTVAVVRGLDYHVDVYPTNGPVVHGPRIPFPWRAITEADQRTLQDSLARVDSLAVAAAGARGRAGVGAPAARLPIRVPPSEWPRYWPPFADQVVAVDDENRLWVRETAPLRADAAQIYAVIDKRGGLVTRVLIPRELALKGFGPGGMVYLAASDGGRMSLLRVRFE